MLVKKGMFLIRDLPVARCQRDMTVLSMTTERHIIFILPKRILRLTSLNSNSGYNAHTGKYMTHFPAGHNEALSV